MNATPKPRLPLIKDLVCLIKAVKKDICPEYRAFDEDGLPGIQLTIGWTPDDGSWHYQTGDNSYSGGAYGHPVWAVGGVYRRTSSVRLARELVDQLAEQSYR